MKRNEERIKINYIYKEIDCYVILFCIEISKRGTIENKILQFFIK